jgi:ABC-type branched-subunit amino acid transport system ATPase component
MLTKLIVANFKTLDRVEIDLGQNVVLIGPNNSGKTSALQALSLWQTGLQEWLSRRSNGSRADIRTGVTINRRDLTHTPVADTRLLWRGLRVTNNAQKVYIDITVTGETTGVPWTCGLQFYHANSESIYCSPLRMDAGTSDSRMPVPTMAGVVRLAMLPPMSGLASEEPEVQPGRIAVLLGEGQTAQVLRNLCLHIFQTKADSWQIICGEMRRLFGIELGKPERDPARGTVSLGYRQNGIILDLPSAGRGMQQTLLLLAHLYANPSTVLMLDEPDAHLEILRQRQIYNLLTETATRTGSQIIAASHSEIVLSEAADKHVVVAFVGKPHRIDDRGSQVLKSLKDIGFDQYYQAKAKGFVLYLEGATDLAFLRAFARTLKHPAEAILDGAFVHYVQNQPKLAEHHYHGLREAKPDLLACAVFDHLERDVPDSFKIPFKSWNRREIENYVTSPSVLLRYASGMEPDDLIGLAQRKAREASMREAIDQVTGNLLGLDKDPWGHSFKVSDDFLPILFKRFFEKLGTDDRLNKSDFHILAEFLPAEEMDPEISATLDLIVAKAAGAQATLAE